MRECCGKAMLFFFPRPRQTPENGLHTECDTWNSGGNVHPQITQMRRDPLRAEARFTNIAPRSARGTQAHPPFHGRGGGRNKISRERCGGRLRGHGFVASRQPRAERGAKFVMRAFARDEQRIR
jgi:hypothetical protein